MHIPAALTHLGGLITKRKKKKKEDEVGSRTQWLGLGGVEIVEKEIEQKVLYTCMKLS